MPDRSVAAPLESNTTDISNEGEFIFIFHFHFQLISIQSSSKVSIFLPVSKNRIFNVKRFPSLLKDFIFKIRMRGNPLIVKEFLFQMLSF